MLPDELEEPDDPDEPLLPELPPRPPLPPPPFLFHRSSKFGRSVSLSPCCCDRGVATRSVSGIATALAYWPKAVSATKAVENFMAIVFIWGEQLMCQSIRVTVARKFDQLKEQVR